MAFLGMRGTGDWVENQMPETWRQAVLKLYPNGSAPLTAILSMMKSNPVDSPVFHWWTQSFPTQGGSITGAYTNASLTSSYTTGGVAGSIIYYKVSEETASEFRVGHQVYAFYNGEDGRGVNGECIGVCKNGASSYLAVRLLEPDDNSGKSQTLANASYCMVAGNLNAEGAPRPDAIAYNPVEFYNYTQIWRNSISQTRTALKTKLRTGDNFAQARADCLELHSIEMENAAIFGVRSSGIGENGKPKRSTMGLLEFVRTCAPANVMDYSSDTDFSGKSWTAGGADFFDKALERLFRYGSTERLALCGSQALLEINRLVKYIGTYEYSPRTVDYGIKVTTWVVPFGVLHLKVHPLLSRQEETRRMMVVLDPKNIVWCPLDDTEYYVGGFGKGEKGTTSGEIGIDGLESEFLTEGGYEFHHACTFGILEGIGKDGPRAQ